ncbi:MAG: hypothetical protein MPN21_03590 [Thermoanaerobaculia bacterium]|nr:hypothetical protein [Thermoanaerobaculia bacterium]
MQLIVTTVVATIAVTTVGILLYMSFMSADRNGWQTLAKSYRLRDHGGGFRGRKFHFCTAVMNGFAFHGILVIGVSGEGLLLHPIWLLRAFHPTLFFPWAALEATALQRTHFRGVRVTLREPQEIDGSPAPLVLEWSEKTHRLVADHLPIG